MWMLNTYFFVMIWAAIRTGQLWTMIPITVIFMLLHYWLADEEEHGTDNRTERPSSYDTDHIHGLLDDTHSDLDNTKAR